MANSKIVMGKDDVPMWESIERGAMELQKCCTCGTFRYPPAPVCPHDLDEKSEWTAISGKGTVLSWVVFHKKYFDDHLPLYNSVAIELDEGPFIVSQLRGDEPEGSWIGRKVELIYAEHAGRIQHFAQLSK